MSKLILFLSYILLCSTTNSQIYSKKTDIEIRDLKGAVAMVKENTLSFNTPDSLQCIADNLIVPYTKFNKKGYITESFHPRHNIGSKWEYIYNGRNQILETWVSHNNEIRKKTRHKPILITDSLQIVEDFSNGKSEGKTFRKYDKNGNQLELAPYGNEDKITSKWLFKYNADGKMTEWKWIDLDGRTSLIITYEYNNEGLLIKEIETNLIYKKVTYSSHGAESSKTIEQNPSNSQPLIDTTEYSYQKIDKFGNWLVRKRIVQSSRDGRNDDIQVRKIEYY